MNKLMRRRRALIGQNGAETSILPSEYQQAAWIGFSGAQRLCIPEPVSYRTNDTVSACYLQTDAAKSCFIVGVLAYSDYENDWSIQTHSGSMTARFVNLGNCGIVNEGEYTVAHGEILAENSRAFNIGSRGLANTAFVGRIKYVRIQRDGELVYNFVPCVRKSDSVIGMYDTVTETFFTNVGTGDFTKGENV